MNVREKNLIPMNKRTPEERRELAKKGAAACNELKRARKTLKEELLLLLSKGDTQQKMSVALINRAKKGDIQAYTTIRDTIGEKPAQEIQGSLNVSYEEALKKVSGADEY